MAFLLNTNVMIHFAGSDHDAEAEDPVAAGAYFRRR
jgi:hypothetical protein